MSRRVMWWEAAGFAAAVAAVYALFVRTGVGQRLDLTALSGTRELPRAVLAEGRNLLDAAGIGVFAVIALGIGALAVLRGRAGLAVAAAAIVAGANVLTQVLKHVVLSRPVLVDHGFAHANSYPSGHATAAASLAVAAVLVVPVRWRAPMALATTSAAAAFGTATVVAGWHLPSDVIGAWLVVGAWTAFVVAVLLEVRGSGADPAPDRWRVRGEVLLVAGAVAAFVVFAMAVAAWAWLRLSQPSASDWIQRGMAFVVAAAGIFGSALAVASSLVLGIRRKTFVPS